VLGSLLLLVVLLRTPAVWLGIALSLASTAVLVRLRRPPDPSVLLKACVIVGLFIGALTSWSVLRRPGLDDYLATAGVEIGSVPRAEVGTQRLGDGLELVTSYPAGVALSRGGKSSCAIGGAGRALPVHVRRLPEQRWLLLENGSARAVIAEDTMQCCWPTQASLAFRARLPRGWLVGSGLGLACALGAKRANEPRQWLLLGASLSALLPLVASLVAFL
jgi:hypothetical protein